MTSIKNTMCLFNLILKFIMKNIKTNLKSENTFQDEVLSIILSFKNRLLELMPDIVSRWSSPILDGQAGFIYPVAYGNLEHKFNKIKIDKNLHDSLKPLIQNIFQLHNELNNYSEKEYRKAFIDELTRLNKMNDNSEILTQMINSHKKKLENWILPKRQKGLYKGACGTYEIIEIYRNDILVRTEMLIDTLYKQNDNIITSLRKNYLIPSEYEQVFILLINDEINNKIEFSKNIEFWKLYSIIHFLTENSFLKIASTNTTKILDFICKIFVYNDGEQKYYNTDLRKKIQKYPSKIKNRDRENNQKIVEYCNEMLEFTKNNNMIFSL